MTHQRKNRLILVTILGGLFLAWESAPTMLARSRHKDLVGNQATEWGRYTVKGEEFSVLLPVMPGMITQTRRISLLDKGRRLRIMGAYADGAVYVIYAFENPQPKQSLEELIAEFGGQSENSTPNSLTLGGFNGKEYSFRLADRSGISQFYITGRHVYLFKAVASSLVNADAAIRKFFSSITLEQSPQGTEVVDGPGQQPTSDYLNVNKNTEAPPVSGRETTSRAVVITKPEPGYTEEARKNSITGTVILRCVFSSSGAVTNIQTVASLPFGLTEKALAAAQQIKFIPAIKDGHFVSMYVQLEYNFNLY